LGEADLSARIQATVTVNGDASQLQQAPSLPGWRVLAAVAALDPRLERLLGGDELASLRQRQRRRFERDGPYRPFA
jgi:hypothetical protein